MEEKHKYINLETDDRIKDDYRRKISFYFPINNKLGELKNITPKNPNNLKLTYEGIYSITRPEQGAQFLGIFKGRNDFKNSILVDGTAGLGGDLIYLGQLFDKCVAFEINSTHANAITSNTQEYGINCEVINKDFTKEYKTVLSNNTILWLDPPWGGPDKWKEDNLKLHFYGDDKIYVNDFIDDCFKCGTSLIILKCPIKTYIADLKERYKVTQHIITKFAQNPNSGDLFQLVIIEAKKTGGRSMRPRGRSMRRRSRSRSASSKKKSGNLKKQTKK